MFKEETNTENMLSFKGPLTVSLVSFMGNHIKNMLKYNQDVVKKLFRVFIELTQNVCYYSAEAIEIEAGSKSGVGWFTIREFDNYFNVTTGNLIFKDDGVKLKKNCEEINSLNDLELRELKRKTRGQAMIRDVGAHIGLIQTSIISKNKLSYKISDLDDRHSFFIISVDISKQ
jgi:hypothetical protein